MAKTKRKLSSINEGKKENTKDIKKKAEAETQLTRENTGKINGNGFKRNSNKIKRKIFIQYRRKKLFYKQKSKLYNRNKQTRNKKNNFF